MLAEIVLLTIATAQCWPRLCYLLQKHTLYSYTLILYFVDKLKSKKIEKNFGGVE